MKTDATTIAGMVADAALTVAARPGLPTPVTAVAGITALPPFSPGTGSRSHRLLMLVPPSSLHYTSVVPPSSLRSKTEGQRREDGGTTEGSRRGQREETVLQA
jgi:hypothetical protein